MAADDSHESLVPQPLDGFTNREQILRHFQQSLQKTQVGELHILSIRGHSGTGKTFLIEYLSKRICPQAGWHAAGLVFVQSLPDFRTILLGLEDALRCCVPRESLKAYRRQREDFNRRFDDNVISITINNQVNATEASTISQVQVQTQVHTEMRRRELQLRAEWTRALLELAEECEQPLCLFLDGYERLVETDHELVDWLWEAVFTSLVKNSPQPMLIVTCGWEHPLSAAVQPYTTQQNLTDFDLTQVRAYLQSQQVRLSQDPQNDALLQAFYELTRGHPLMLALATTYMQALPAADCTPESLHAQSPLITEEARIQWLEGRLLKRLPEPYRTLLERGPILRSFDQASLQALLQAEPAITMDQQVDDRTYARFLYYPFINRKYSSNNGLLAQPTFHDLTRRVRLDTLRRLHPETKQQLHRAMAGYYQNRMDAAMQQDHSVHVIAPLIAYAEWFALIPERAFHSLLEYFYHALQVEELQEKAFEWWDEVTVQAVERWQRTQAGLLLELVQQLVMQQEPFIARKSHPYGRYLITYAHYLEQEARWDESLHALQVARGIFDQRGDLVGQAHCLNHIGYLHKTRGEYEQALDNYQKAFILREQIGDPATIASSLNNIGYLYNIQGEFTQALDNYQRALILREQVGDPADIAQSLNHIGYLYNTRGELEQSLDYYQRALTLSEQVGNPAAVATSLHNIGYLYNTRKEFEQALNYYQRALTLREQVGNPAAIANSLNNIGGIYGTQGEFERALDYYQRALALFEQVDDSVAIAQSLNNIGYLYSMQEEYKQALDYYQRALTFFEQVGNPVDIALSCHNIAFLYHQQEQWEDAISLFSRALSFYERMSSEFTSDVIEELELLADCYTELGDFGKVEFYVEQARTLQERLPRSQA